MMGSVKTRTLLILAVVTGLAILVAGAVQIPLHDLHAADLSALDPTRRTAVVCQSSQRSGIGASILAARGFRPGQDLANYISPTLKNGLPEPEKLKNLAAAAKLIADVHRAGGSVAICCDFDVDGLSGGSVVHDFFNAVGITSKVFVPDRFVDGYGLNEKTVRDIAAQGFKLLLTIDFGTTNSVVALAGVLAVAGQVGGVAAEVANRTGLAPGKTPRQVEDKLMKIVPKKYLVHAHHWLILHGRYVCKARRPECNRCIIFDLCNSNEKISNLTSTAK